MMYSYIQKNIPNGWRLKQLGDIGNVLMCKRILKEQTSPNGDVPFYKIGTFGKEPDAFISKELYNKYKRKEISLEDAINQSQSIADQSHTDNKPIADQSQSIAEKKREDKNRIYSKEKFANKIRLLSTNLPKSEIEKFIDYWTEKNPNGKKMKFEKQKTFDPNLRLKRWESNYKEFKKVGTNNPPTATKKQLK